ncbi:hypothetical protein KM043_006435 [Ampulex compressa]|nr:hypothetical protein KM043_006435 [Ampulex compressa]
MNISKQTTLKIEHQNIRFYRFNDGVMKFAMQSSLIEYSESKELYKEHRGTESSNRDATTKILTVADDESIRIAGTMLASRPRSFERCSFEKFLASSRNIIEPRLERGINELLEAKIRNDDSRVCRTTAG